MIELFAWLLDQRIYWIDRTPDSLGLAALSLLGFAPRAAQAAVTVLQLFDAAPAPRPLPLTTAGTLFQLQDSNPALIFTTDDALAVLPTLSGGAIGLTINSIDRSLDLRQGRLVPLTGAGANSAQVEITLSLNAEILQSRRASSFP